eukprot:m.314731 g.314731  ORF g.314731 m.314731 type:complete len:332 (-) comp27506_c0_seq3:5489-6484(-)
MTYRDFFFWPEGLEGTQTCHALEWLPLERASEIKDLLNNWLDNWPIHCSLVDDIELNVHFATGATLLCLSLSVEPCPCLHFGHEYAEQRVGLFAEVNVGAKLSPKSLTLDPLAVVDKRPRIDVKVEMPPQHPQRRFDNVQRELLRVHSTVETVAESLKRALRSAVRGSHPKVVVLCRPQDLDCSVEGRRPGNRRIAKQTPPSGWPRARLKHWREFRLWELEWLPSTRRLHSATHSSVDVPNDIGERVHKTTFDLALRLLSNGIKVKFRERLIRVGEHRQDGEHQSLEPIRVSPQDLVDRGGVPRATYLPNQCSDDAELFDRKWRRPNRLSA